MYEFNWIDKVSVETKVLNEIKDENEHSDFALIFWNTAGCKNTIRRCDPQLHTK